VFRYSVYGLDLACDTELPELNFRGDGPIEAALPINVFLQVGDHYVVPQSSWFLRSARANGDDWALCGKIEDGYLLRYLGFADFIVTEGGRTLRCAYVERGTSAQTLRHLLLDQALPLVLNLLGCDVLHATAVATHRGICAFIGPAGAGKSTLAASIATAGYATFCDDCLVIRRNGSIACLPGYPGVRLWNDSLAALGIQPTKVGRVADYTSKYRIVSERPGLPTSVSPLITIYSVCRQASGEQSLSAACIERLAGREAFMQLVSSAFVLDVTDPSTLLRHFRFVEELVTHVPISRLLLPNDFTSLPGTCRAILSELGEL
jgi:hypothetical protein